MAYLGAAANRSRAEAEDSAGQARESARLAEERLTASLIAQGKRELNDNRAIAALAYFGEALRRGADSPALRLMISVAARGWPDEVAVRRGASMTHAESSPRGWAVSADAQGRLHWWSADGAVVAEQATDLGFITSLYRQPDDRLIAIGRKGLAVIDPATREVAHRFAPKSEPMIARLGPGADEISTVEHDGVRVYDLAGTERRKLALAARAPQGEPHYDAAGAHLTFGTNRDVEVIDLRAMTSRTIAKNTDGMLAGAADGSVAGYVDTDGVAHLLAGDGAELRTFRPANRPYMLVFSPAGDRIGAVAENTMLVHDAAGKPLHSVPLKSTLVMIEIRGDDVWLGTTDGVVQRWRRGTLIASLPSQLGDLAQFHVGDKLVMSVGMDGAFVAVRASAEQLRLQPRLCDQVDLQVEGIATIYRCADRKAHVFVGAAEVAVVDEDDAGVVAHHAASRRTALGGRAHIRIYEGRRGDATTAHDRDHETQLAFEDAAHLLVTRPEDDDHGVWRWTFASDRWERVAAVKKAGPVATAAGGIFVGTGDHLVVRLRHGAEASSVDVGARPLTLAASRDGRWVVASLQNGVAAILDGETGALVRQLEQTDSLGGTAAFDDAGDLLLRPGRGTMTIWDRASGDNLVWNLDLLRYAASARFDDAGRLEVNTWDVGVLDLRRDTRPAAQLLADIDCKVPLRVIGSRLGPAVPACDARR
ncbi:MAG: hypothetical protein KIT31_12870 [Deltaproteobacteria bacterium]|nr:hypothetical protein [Deltaproteobacteria bacterium]